MPKKSPYIVRLDPNSQYHSLLIKKYGKQDALKQLQGSNLRYLLETAWLPKMAGKFAKV